MGKNTNQARIAEAGKNHQAGKAGLPAALSILLLKALYGSRFFGGNQEPGTSFRARLNKPSTWLFRGPPAFNQRPKGSTAGLVLWFFLHKVTLAQNPKPVTGVY